MEACLSRCNEDEILVFTDGEDEPEWYVRKDFLEAYGEDSLSSEPDISISETILESMYYWKLAIDLINVWSKFQTKEKLYANAINREVCDRVAHVITRYYGGNLRKLREHISDLSFEVEKSLLDFNNCCRKSRVEIVDRRWLRRYLLRSEDYKSIRSECKRRMAAGESPAALRTLI